MNSSIEQGTEGNEKKQQLAKEYKEKVRFGENFFWNNSEAYILMAKYPYEIDEKYLKSFSLRFPSGTFEMTCEPIPRCFSKRGRMTTTTALSRWLLENCWPTFKIVNSRSFSCDAKAAVIDPYCM